MESTDNEKRHILLCRNFFNNLELIYRNYTTPFLIIFLSSLVIIVVCSVWIDPATFSESSTSKLILTRKTPYKDLYPVNCTKTNVTEGCPRTYPTRHIKPIHYSPSLSLTCPSYFQWIHEDLQPWKETGITKDMVEKARDMAHFRLVVVNGKAYIEKFKKSYQTRDLFTIWGILQLLRVYPGQLPDFELMFNCDDIPLVQARDYLEPNAQPPPLFKYCSNKSALDIVFPDWSFWGWPELKIKPWKNVLEDIKQANRRRKWKERIPYAYWKGNPTVAKIRLNLLKCNASQKYDWNARLYRQNWAQEIKRGYRQSNLADQCTHRYKIYIEGNAWSVSEKYILACESMTLYVKSKFDDFVSRGMMPLKHYWPIRNNQNMCSSIKFAVEWGNHHTEKAEAIGKAGRKFMEDDLKMEYVYDYMFHLLNEYAKLLKFKPIIPSGAIEVCSEVLACSTNGRSKEYMLDSLIKSPSEKYPCTLPQHDHQLLYDFGERKVNSIRQAEMWEDEYWKNS